MNHKTAPALALATAFGVAIGASFAPAGKVKTCDDIGGRCADETVMVGYDAVGTRLRIPSGGQDPELAWDSGSMPWSEIGTEDESDGSANIAKARLSSAFGSLAAVAHCTQLRANGHDDWYLPSRGELQTIFGNHLAIDELKGHGTGRYWTSDEYDNRFAWAQDLSDGHQSQDAKSLKYHALCVRHASP